MPLPSALDLVGVEERGAAFVECLGVLAEVLVHLELSGNVVQLLGVAALVGRVGVESQLLGPALAINASEGSHCVAMKCEVSGRQCRLAMSIGKLL